MSSASQQHEATGIVPTELDILCGKTKQIINHPGTIQYQKVVESYTQRYINAESKFDKMTVTKSLYEYLQTTSRFLKFNEKEQAWEEIASLAARDKVGHALRFAVNNKDGKKAKKRARRRSHRRVGSDYSFTSLSSEVSANSGPSTSSDGVPRVQALMQALSTQSPPTVGKATQALMRALSAQSSSSAAATDKATPFPTVTTSSGGDQTLPPLLAVPKMTPAARGGSTGSNLSDLGLADSNMSHSELAYAAIAAEMAQETIPQTTFPTANSELVLLQNLLNTTLNAPTFSRGDSAGSDLSLSVNGSNPQLVSSVHSGQQVAMSPSPSPPLPVVVATPEPCNSGVQTMNSDFLSMLQEPIYEFGLDQDEDL